MCRWHDSDEKTSESARGLPVNISDINMYKLHSNTPEQSNGPLSRSGFFQKCSPVREAR